MKKILFLSSGDTYGAYEFIYRMAKFMEEDHQISMIVLDRRKTDKWIYRIPTNSKKKNLLLKLFNYVKRNIGIRSKFLQTDPKYCFLNEDENIDYTTSEEILRYLNFRPDIVLSGMTDGFVNTSTLLGLRKKTGATIYQVMVDSSFVTGGCHVLWGCNNYIYDCIDCPAIITRTFKNYSAENFRIKYKNIQEGDFRLLIVPGWSEKIAKLSLLYRNRINVITTSIIDTNVFTNTNREIAKKVFNLPSFSKVIFAGSNNVRNPRKGRAFLVEALGQLWESMEEDKRNDVFVLLAGNENKEDEETQKIKFNKKLIEFINDDRLLSLAYQASEVFVNTSIEDAGPMMVAEALSCGTPVVGFETGILFENSIFNDDMRRFHLKIGDIKGLTRAIKNVIDLDKIRFKQLSDTCRTLAEENFSKKAFLNCMKSLN